MECGLSVKRACEALRLTRSAYYRPVRDRAVEDAPVVEGLNQVVAKNGRWGFWKCYDRLRLDGQLWNHKRVHRIYKAMKLNLPRRTKKRIPARIQQPLEVVRQPNIMWSMDFMHDALYQGRRFRTLNVLDEGVRECLAIEVDTSLTAERVIRVLEQLKAGRGLPRQIRVDNGPELIADKLADWCKANHVELVYIQPGKPTQNAYIERFNRTFRYEVLDAHLFDNLEQVREISWNWLRCYNEERPHDALGGIPPSHFRKQVTAENSTNNLSS